MSENEVILSRVTNASRDKVLAFAAWKKAEDRLKNAVDAAYEAGCTDKEITVAVQMAARGNERVRQAMIEYAEAIEKDKN